MIHLHSAHPTPNPLPSRASAESGDRATIAGRDPAEARQIRELAARDRQVRTHERAHLAAAGNLANGGAKFQYTRGPDGRQYATGGEVSIDVSPVANDPQATIDKAQKIRRAALAPAEPSGQDRAVAARATAMANEARLELQREARETGDADDVGICKQCGRRHGGSEDELATGDRAGGYLKPIESAPHTVDATA